MRESFGIRIDCADPARIWTGFGNLAVPADIVESAPTIYYGGAELLSAPDFEHPFNGQAERLDIRLSGISARIVQMAQEQAASVKGAKVHFVRFYFNADWSLQDVEYEAVFRADKLSFSSEDDGAGGRNRVLTLSIATDDTNRNRAPASFFTDQDQRRRSPTDAIFSHVSGITQGVLRRFGTR
jgi:hypothetical protein